MPLNKSGSEESVGENISIEKHAHPEMAQKQAIAIAENTKREANKHHDGKECALDFGYGEGDPVGSKDSGYSQVGTPESLVHTAKQMWSEAASASEKESNNGVTTPEA